MAREGAASLARGLAPGRAAAQLCIINGEVEAIRPLSVPAHPRMDFATSRFEPGG
jgi:hypothetical protein